MPGNQVNLVDQDVYETRIGLLEARVAQLRRPSAAPRLLYRAFTYICIGLGYQAIAYGDAPWNSVLTMGHIFGWVVFAVVSLALFMVHISLWVLLGAVGIALAIGVIYMAERIRIWNVRRKYRGLVARRSGGRS
jgi:hypothetical protein